MLEAFGNKKGLKTRYLGNKYRELGLELERGVGITCDDMPGMYCFNSNTRYGDARIELFNNRSGCLGKSINISKAHKVHLDCIWIAVIVQVFLEFGCHQPLPHTPEKMPR